MRRTVLLLAAVLLCGAAAPAAAPASTRADRVASAQAFARLSARFAVRLNTADPAAQRALRRARARARTCLPVWEHAPLKWRSDLGSIYFNTLAGALWTADGPVYAAWVADLRRSSQVPRSPVIVRGVGALAREVAGADKIFATLPDPCPTITAWRDAGWSPAARPPGLAVFDGLDEEQPDGRGPDDQAIYDTAIRQVGRYSKIGRLLDGVLSTGVDEPDSRVNDTAGRCDPVGRLVLASEYEDC